MDNRPLSRRTFTKSIGVGTAAMISSHALPSHALQQLIATPAQVEGPFHPTAEQLDKDLDLTSIKGRNDRAAGETIWVEGKVLTVDGKALAGCVVDIWQANHHGRYAHAADRNNAPLDPAFQGWGVIKTDAAGRYTIKTVKPGPYPLASLGQAGKWRCRHIHFKVSHPQHRTLTTQMYFKGDPLIAQDFEIERTAETLRHLLIANFSLDKKSGLPRYQFNIVLNSQ